MFSPRYLNRSQAEAVCTEFLTLCEAERLKAHLREAAAVVPNESVAGWLETIDAVEALRDKVLATFPEGAT